MVRWCEKYKTTHIRTHIIMYILHTHVIRKKSEIRYYLYRVLFIFELMLRSDEGIIRKRLDGHFYDVLVQMMKECGKKIVWSKAHGRKND